MRGVCVYVAYTIICSVYNNDNMINFTPGDILVIRNRSMKSVEIRFVW